MRSLTAHLKIGDYATIASGALFAVFLALVFWQGAEADRAIIRSGGKVFDVVPLSRDKIIEVPGPLGISRIDIRNRQARIAADPGRRQYCVRQGWLKQAGEIAICLPNQVSVELGGSQEKRYDSLNY